MTPAKRMQALDVPHQLRLRGAHVRKGCGSRRMPGPPTESVSIDGPLFGKGAFDLDQAHA